MQAQELKQLTVALAAIAERLDARSASAVERVEQATHRMQDETRRLELGASGFTREVSQALQQRSAEIIGQGMAAAFTRFNQQMEAATKRAAVAADALEKERLALQQQRRSGIWISSGALLIGSLLAVGGSAYAVHHSYTRVEQHRIQAELLRAYNRADVVLCGERLCANVDDKTPRAGAQGQYRPVKPR